MKEWKKVLHHLPLVRNALLFAVAYFLGGHLAQTLNHIDSPVATIWLPSGLFVAVLLVTRYTHWPAYLVAGLVAELAYDFSLGRPYYVSLLFFAGNALEATCGAWLIRKFAGDNFTLDEPKKVGVLAVFSALLSTIIGASIGSATVVNLLSGGSFWVNWLTWWSGDAMGILVVAPLVLAWVRLGFLPGKPNILAAVELACLVAVLVGASYLIFLLPFNVFTSRVYLIIPILVWAALRFDLRVTTSVILTAVIFAAYGTRIELGAFSPPWDTLEEHVISLQLFSGILIFTVLLLASIWEERKQAFQRLRESEAGLKKAQQVAQVGSWSWNLQTDQLNWSDEMYRIFGLDPSNFTGSLAEVVAQCIHPDDRQSVEMANATVLQAATPVPLEYRVVRADGSIRTVWAEAGELTFDQANHPLLISGIAQDITERKKIEIALRESEEWFSRVFLASPVGIGIISLENTTFIDANQALLSLLGYQRAEMIGRSTFELGIWDDSQAQHSTLRKLVEVGQLRSHDARFRRKSGEILDVILAAEVIETQGEKFILAIVHDITERRAAENTIDAIVKGTARTLGEEYFSTLVRYLAHAFKAHYVFVGELTPNRTSIRTLAAWIGDGPGENFEYELHGTPCDEVIGKKTCIISSGVQKLFPEDVLLAQMGVEAYCGVPLFDPRGLPLGILVLLNTQPLAEPDRRISALLEVFAARAAAELERKRVEDTLRESEKKFRTFIEESSDGIALIDEQGKINEWNRANEKITGLSKQEVHGKYFWDVLYQLTIPLEKTPAQLERYRQIFQQGLLTGESNFFNRSFDTIVQRGDGAIRHIEQTGFPIKSEQGFRMGAICQDITERKQTLEALRRSEGRLSIAEQMAHLGYWEYEFESQEFVFSRETSRLYGYRDDTHITTKMILDRIHPDDLRGVHEHHQAVLAQGGTFDYEYRILLPDGNTRIIHSQGSAACNPDGSLKSIFGTLMDITERKQAEQQIREALSEKEVLLRELYHRTKNNMQVIRSMLVLQSMNSDNREVQKLVQDTDSKIMAMATVHQMLYQSQNLSSINLESYIRELVELSRTSYQTQATQVDFELDLEPIWVTIDIATPLGLIFDELLSNAFKHAFPAGRPGIIQIELKRQEPGMILIKFSDNGVGVPEGFDVRKQITYGLVSMLSLAESQLNGHVSVDTRLGVGYTFEFSDALYRTRL